MQLLVLSLVPLMMSAGGLLSDHSLGFPSGPNGHPLSFPNRHLAFGFRLARITKKMDNDKHEIMMKEDLRHVCFMLGPNVPEECDFEEKDHRKKSWNCDYEKTLDIRALKTYSKFIALMLEDEETGQEKNTSRNNTDSVPLLTIWLPNISKVGVLRQILYKVKWFARSLKTPGWSPKGCGISLEHYKKRFGCDADQRLVDLLEAARYLGIDLYAEMFEVAIARRLVEQFSDNRKMKGPSSKKEEGLKGREKALDEARDAKDVVLSTNVSTMDISKESQDDLGFPEAVHRNFFVQRLNPKKTLPYIAQWVVILTDLSPRGRAIVSALGKELQFRERDALVLSTKNEQVNSTTSSTKAELLFKTSEGKKKSEGILIKSEGISKTKSEGILQSDGIKVQVLPELHWWLRDRLLREFAPYGLGLKEDSTFSTKKSFAIVRPIDLEEWKSLFPPRNPGDEFFFPGFSAEDDEQKNRLIQLGDIHGGDVFSRGQDPLTRIDAVLGAARAQSEQLEQFYERAFKEAADRDEVAQNALEHQGDSFLQTAERLFPRDTVEKFVRNSSAQAKRRFDRGELGWSGMFDGRCFVAMLFSKLPTPFLKERFWDKALSTMMKRSNYKREDNWDFPWGSFGLWKYLPDSLKLQEEKYWRGVLDNLPLYLGYSGMAKLVFRYAPKALQENETFFLAVIEKTSEHEVDTLFKWAGRLKLHGLRENPRFWRPLLLQTQPGISRSGNGLHMTEAIFLDASARLRSNPEFFKLAVQQAPEGAVPFLLSHVPGLGREEEAEEAANNDNNNVLIPANNDNKDVVLIVPAKETPLLKRKEIMNIKKEKWTSDEKQIWKTAIEEDANYRWGERNKHWMKEQFWRREQFWYVFACASDALQRTPEFWQLAIAKCEVPLSSTLEDSRLTSEEGSATFYEDRLSCLADLMSMSNASDAVQLDQHASFRSAILTKAAEWSSCSDETPTLFTKECVVEEENPTLTKEGVVVEEETPTFITTEKGSSGLLFHQALPEWHPLKDVSKHVRGSGVLEIFRKATKALKRNKVFQREVLQRIVEYNKLKFVGGSPSMNPAASENRHEQQHDGRETVDTKENRGNSCQEVSPMMEIESLDKAIDFLAKEIIAAADNEASTQSTSESNDSGDYTAKEQMHQSPTILPMKTITAQLKEMVAADLRIQDSDHNGGR